MLVHWYGPGEIDSAFVYEDRTRRFFPPAPRVPRMPGLNAGDADLSQLVVLSFGELTENLVKPKGKNVLKDEEYAEVQKFSLKVVATDKGREVEVGGGGEGELDNRGYNRGERKRGRNRRHGDEDA
ncbi:hypothetical protein BHE74_00022895 [Ensete ventricosum]|nr:hypothetical protein BHE74_00022895 [Ensete ventricosum]